MDLKVPRLASISHDAFRVWGVSAEAAARIRAACESFVRVSPVARPMPPADEFGDVRRALDVYRKTSPKMIVFGRMIGDAMPSGSCLTVRGANNTRILA